MSTPEAKQAADESGYQTTAYREAFAIGYDTATAKLREELEEEQPSADVEKIAREAVIKLQDSCIHLDPRIAMTVMREAIAQALTGTEEKR